MILWYLIDVQDTEELLVEAKMTSEIYIHNYPIDSINYDQSSKVAYACIYIKHNAINNDIAAIHISSHKQ